jgi:hypothetical protein
MESPVLISDPSVNESGPSRFAPNHQLSSLELQERRSMEPSSYDQLLHEIFSSDEADDTLVGEVTGNNLNYNTNIIFR